MPGVDSLRFKLAIRTVMEQVWYSNAVPEWYTPERIDEGERVKRLSDRAGCYLKGDNPLPVLPFQVPRLTGGMRTWVVPAVNDQMIMQACVTNLARSIAKGFDHKRVFSCEPDDNPNRIAFMKPQIAALLEFHKETIRRLQQGAFVLQVDIEKAFASIERARVFEFLEQLRPKSVEVDLIRRLMNAWSGKESGIPLVNDSVFFLGSAYLGVIDGEISKIANDFIRYMDDYRVFGRSQAELEAVFEKISRGLSQLGLKVNPRKVRIGSRNDFLQPVTEPRVARKPEYVIELDTGIVGQVEPEQLATLVARALENPNDYLNEGFGRYLLGALRRYRLNLAIHRRAGRADAGLGVRLQKLLVGNARAVQLTGARLGEYGKDTQNTWRAIWVMYLIEQQGTAKRFQPQLEQIERSTQMPTVAKLWARRCRLGIGGEPERLGDEVLHDMSYLDAGRRCYGERLCRGEGF